MINLPLLIATINTGNWSDDYQYTNLFVVKAKFSPILPLLFDTTGGHIQQGGHFAPFYNLINLLITSVSIDPQFFHLIIVICYILTAFLIFLLVNTYYKDKTLGILAGTLFAINYYIGFRALAWNCFHSHLTNTLTGLISLYFLIIYVHKKKKFALLICAFFFLLTIFNYESGFIFFPFLIIIALFSLLKKVISFKQLILIILVLSMTMALFPLGAYLKTGNAIPLSYRFKWGRSIQGYAFKANELFIKSTGLSLLYHQLIFDKLKQKRELKEVVKRLIRENKGEILKNLSTQFIVTLLTLGIFIILLFVALMVIIFKRIKPQTYPFTVVYLCLFLIYIFVFYRTDVTNAIAIPSCIIIADVVVSFLREEKKGLRKIGIGILGLYLIVTIWTVFDGFDYCYRKNLFGLSKNALKAPDRLYKEINRKIGRYADKGAIFFVDDYSDYKYIDGFYSNPDIMNIRDFACFNATVYYRDLLRTDIVKKYKNIKFEDFARFIASLNKRFVVSSMGEALEYLRDNNIDTSKVEAIYVSQNYQPVKLK